MGKVRVFVSFDVEHDGKLFEDLRAHSSSSGFAVSGCSERPSDTDDWRERVRQQVHEADQVIFICSEHTETSISMSTELRIARQEGTPYFLLWGRREIMCTKPMGAKVDEGMYSWTPQILQDQIVSLSRSARSDAMALALRNTRRTRSPIAPGSDGRTAQRSDAAPLLGDSEQAHPVAAPLSDVRATLDGTDLSGRNIKVSEAQDRRDGAGASRR